MRVKNCVLIEPFTCLETDSVVEVAKKLRTTTLRHIFVVDAKNFPKGIISVIDINNRVVAENKDANKLKAKDIMTTPVDIVSVGDDTDIISKDMIKKGRVMNPVVNENNMMVGIITLNQCLKEDKK